MFWQKNIESSQQYLACEKVEVIGTLLKIQNLKPNIFKEAGEENAITNKEVPVKQSITNVL